MKILSIIAQKPSSTGSGVYLSELVRCFKEMGHEQEIICAAYESDVVGANTCGARTGEFYEPVYNKIIFDTKELPIRIAGMSDAMPYPSIKYSELVSNEDKLKMWMTAFDKKVREVLDRLKPDLIICHHLYLLTSMVVNIVTQQFDNSIVGESTASPWRFELCEQQIDKVPLIYGICHNTDLRQYQQTNLKRDFIKENIKKLDRLFFLSKEHADKAIELFDFDKSKAEIIGIGYNNNIFKNNRDVAHIVRDNNQVLKHIVGADMPERLCRSVATECNKIPLGDIRPSMGKHREPTTTLLYVGKVCKKKGVLSLIKAIEVLNDENIVLDIIGGAGDKVEYDEMISESKKSKSKINFIGPMTQDKLAIEYNSHDIFVLPSFFEGLPLVPLEAMACGCKVVISDLPGVKNYYDANVKNASIKYVELPKLTNVDNASIEELEAFEKRLAGAIRESIDDNNTYKPDLSNITWDNIAKNIIKVDE